MLSINEKISLRQLQALIIISGMGTGVIVLPRRVAEYAGSDGWIIVLWLTVLAMIFGALVSTAARLRPADGFIQSTGFYLTRPVAYILGAVLWLKLVMTAGLELRVFMLVVREVLLKHTPMFITGIVLLAVAAYAAVKGIETRARVAEVLIILMALPFAFLVIVALTDIDFSNLQPVLATPPRTLLQGTLRLGFMFTGLECVLLVSPYIHPKKKMRRAVISALGFAGLIIAGITVLTLGKFGRGVVDLPWPVLSMMDMLNLPGSFIERQEALMFSFWIITNFAFVSGLLFFGGVLFKDFMRAKTPPNRRPHGPSRANRPWQLGVLITTVAVFIITCIPWDKSEIYERMDFMYLTLGAFFLGVLPVILILASVFKKDKNDKMDKTDKMDSGTPKTVASSKAKPMVLIALGAISLLALTSCWDKIEIENRAFVIAVGIDKAEDENGKDDKENNDARYTVTLSLPPPTSGTDGNAGDAGEGEDDPPYIKKASAKTITEAIKKINAETDAPLYFGQTKILVLGDELLKEPDLLRGALDFFNRHQEIDRAMYVLAAHEKGADILTATPPGDGLPGRYIAAIYRDKHKIGGTSFYVSMDKLVTQMKYDNVAMLPIVKEDDDKLSLSGAVLLNHARKAGELSADELRGYLWCFDEGGLGAVITPVSEGQPVPFKVEKHTANIRFQKHDGKLQAHIRVELTGRIDECPSENALLERASYRRHIVELVEKTVKDEIRSTADKLQNELKLDGYHWLEIMRKKQHGLYRAYAPHWNEVFPDIKILPDVKVTVRT